MVPRLGQPGRHVRGAIERSKYFQFVFLSAGYGHVRALQVLLVDDVVDAFALMSSDVLGVRVRQLLVVLYREVLPLDVLFEFFSLDVAMGGLLKALFDLGGVICVQWRIGACSAFAVAVLELIV